MEIDIVLPAVSGEPLSGMLREITKAIVERNPDRQVGGLLGGEFGYGAKWDSPVFMMHPFCWCERESCPWCCGCECSADGPECEFCRGEFPPPETGAIHNYHGAPNFWHKPSGLRVWWYKYIGRGMELANVPPDLSPIFADCLRDIASAIEARSDETRSGSAEGESATPKGDQPHD